MFGLAWYSVGHLSRRVQFLTVDDGFPRNDSLKMTELTTLNSTKSYFHQDCK